MISLQCTHCQQRLEMDDAFAGGVCRCQHCGTIQTVPKKGRAGSGKSSSSSSSKSSSSKALYKKASPGQTEPPASSGTGLDELAQVVASSGLARGSLRKPPPPKRESARAAGGSGTGEDSSSSAAPANAIPMRLVLIGGGAVIAILLILVLYFAFRTPQPPPTAARGGGPSGASAASPTNTSGESATPAGDVGPSFAGIPLRGGGDVIYLLDRSQANDTFLDALKAAAYKSALSLGRNRNFQIIFWHRTDEGIVAYPEDHTAPATAKEIDAARKRFEDVVAYGTTDLKPTIAKAVASSPGAIVIATAKGFSLEDTNAAAVHEALKGADVKVHTVSLGESESAVLKQIAEQGGGEYRVVSQKQLRAMSN